MAASRILLVSSDEINIPGFQHPIRVRDIKALVIKDLIICEIVLHSGKVYTGLEYLPKVKD